LPSFRRSASDDRDVLKPAIEKTIDDGNGVRSRGEMKHFPLAERDRAITWVSQKSSEKSAS
jgi:hypothetical protein